MNAARTTLGQALRRWQRGIALAALGMLALAGMTLSTVADAQIAFRNAASASSRAPFFRGASSSTTAIFFVNADQDRTTTGTLNINTPGGIVLDDMLIASIAVTPSSATITAPAGWVPVGARLNNAGPTSNSLAVFRKPATAAEPGSYNFTVTGSTNSVGGIQVFRNVDLATPIDVTAGVNTVSGLPHAAPSVTTTVANTMLVTSHAYASDRSFSTPAGMTEEFDEQSPNVNGAIGMTISGNWQAIAAVGATGIRTANASADADAGNAHSLALRQMAPRLRIVLPGGTTTNDVMIASVGVQPSTATVTAPAGWTPMLRTNNAAVTSNSLAVFRRTAAAGEPAFYDFALGGGATVAVGGIQSFFNADIVSASPIDIENGQTTASGTAHATPSVATTGVNRMLVTSHTYASSRTWTAPAGMTEAFDRPSGANSATGQSIGGNYVQQPVAGLTGAKSATAAGDADVGNAHILALSAPPGTTLLTINVPAGTVANDVMVASVGVTPDASTITTPAGWTLLRRTDGTSGTNNSLATYYRVATGAEPANYTWLITNFSDAAGGIQSFVRVDTSLVPQSLLVNVEDGNNTGSSLNHATPSVTPTVANVMLVTAHTMSSSATWTLPVLPMPWNEAYDLATNTVPNAAGLSIVGGYQDHVFLPTGTRTATASNNADGGNAHIVALRPIPVIGQTGGFNAYDTGTAAGAIIGNIRTKIAGTTVNLHIISLNMPRTAIQTDFTGTVTVDVMNSSNNGGAIDAYGCRSTWSVIQTLPGPVTFAAGDNGRKAISFTEANSYPDVRIRVSYPTVSPVRIGCSADNFAIRPNTFTSYSVTDLDWQTAGTTRTLGNTVAPPGGIIHKAGRPFTVRATAVNGAGSPATTTNYTGAPTPTLTDCGASSACPATLGTVTLGSPFVAGVLNATTATYSEVGSFNMQLVDTTFSNVDAADGSPADCTAAGRYVCGGTLAVGRFVPDNFAVAYNAVTFGTTCGSFSYVGQTFNYTTAPVMTLTARNFAGGTTANYAGALWQITNTSLTGRSYTWATGTLDTTGLPLTSIDPVISSGALGVGTLTFSSGTGLFFTRTTPVAPFNADISLAINVIDADNVVLASPPTNPARFGTATPGGGMAFSAGKPMRFGLLRLDNAAGSGNQDLPIPIRTQYWNGTAFVTNSADNCTSISAANIAFSNYFGGITAGNMNSANISGLGVPFTAGVGNLRLTKPMPAPGSPGAVTLTVNLTAEGKSYLKGNWPGPTYTADPSARATFGLYASQPNNFIFFRENY